MNLKKIKQLNIDDKKIKNLNKNNFACLKKIKKELNWKPLINIDKGIESLCLKNRNEKIYKK